VEFSPSGDRSSRRLLTVCKLGGGYPELWADTLAANVDMQTAVRRFVEDRAERSTPNAAAMYSRAVDPGTRWTGLADGRCTLPFSVVMTERLQQFGYVEVTLTRDCMLGAAERRSAVTASIVPGSRTSPPTSPIRARLRYPGWQREPKAFPWEACSPATFICISSRVQVCRRARSQCRATPRSGDGAEAPR
jgi:hypothetical protein